MIRLTPEVALVGSGRLGMNQTHSHDSNVYLVGGPRGAVLIDAGCGLGVEAMVREVDLSDLPRDAIRAILLTHGHADHAGGAHGLAAELGATVLGSSTTAEIVSSGDEVRSGLSAARGVGVYPSETVLKATPVVRLENRATLEVQGGTVSVLETPGHADGHLAFVLETTAGVSVFTGDLVFSRGRVAVLSTADSRPHLLASSIAGVLACQPTTLFPGHAEPVLADASAHLRSALTALRSGQLPGPLT